MEPKEGSLLCLQVYATSADITLFKSNFYFYCVDITKLYTWQQV
jgi:hypothetical protein